MTAYIDNIIIQGTPEEIQEFMELREKHSFGNTDYKLCTTCYSAPCQCSTAYMGASLNPCPICQQNPCGCTNTGKFSKDYTTAN